MQMDLVDSLLNAAPRDDDALELAAAPAVPAVDVAAPAVEIAASAVEIAAPAPSHDNAMTDEDSVQIRTMEIPRWLSTPEVTKFLVGQGRSKALEKEYESTICITGHGSGTKDPNAPGFHLPHLLVTMTGSDVRQLGRLRRVLEDSLVDYVLDNSTEPTEEDTVNPPPSLGRLLYGLGLSAADASPKTKDHAPDRTVLARSHFPAYLHAGREAAGGGDDGGGRAEQRRGGRRARKVWMNVAELPRDGAAGEYHGRFLASRSFMNYYRSHFRCRVDINGVWGEDPEENLMCAPYVLITGDEKANVDKCIQYVEHRIRDHEEKFGVARAGGQRVLKGEKKESDN